MRSKRSLDPKVFLARPGQGRKILTYQEHRIVFSQGDASDAVFFIQKGKVKVSVISVQGKEVITAILGPGDFFGEACVSGQARRPATVQTITECVIVRLEKKTIVHLINEEPGFAKMFIAHLIARALRTEADLVDQLCNSSEKRLARLLLLLANYDKEGRPKLAIDKISQEMLADMIGTTRARVSKFMNKFRKLGFIDYNGQIHVHRALLNNLLHDQPEITVADGALLAASTTFGEQLGTARFEKVR